jgi:Protein of unknown function (DUF3644).
LVEKAKEAAMTAVQAYNNPLTRFKSESFIVLMMVAWTYLLHAYYRQQGIEYRYYRQGKRRRRFDHNPNGTFRYWDLKKCLSVDACPLDRPTVANLRFLHDLRDEIEHHMPPGMDDYLGSRYLACTLNLEYWVTKLFGDRHSLQSQVALALQFGDIERASDEAPEAALPARIAKYVREFEERLPADEFLSERYKYSVFFIKRTVGKPGQADRVVEFVSPDDPRATGLKTEYYTIRETEKPKFLPGQIAEMMKAEGFVHFGMQRHIELWKARDGKNPAKGYGVEIGGVWYWYERWVDIVRDHCRSNASRYR